MKYDHFEKLAQRLGALEMDGKRFYRSAGLATVSIYVPFHTVEQGFTLHMEFEIRDEVPPDCMPEVEADILAAVAAIGGFAGKWS